MVARRTLSRGLPGLLLLAGLVSCIPIRSNQPTGHFCEAPNPGAEYGPIWWRLRGSRAFTKPAPAPADVGRSLAGTWHVLTVTTEGIGAGSGGEWRLRLVPTDSSASSRCALGPCNARRILVVAAGAPVKPGTTFDSSAAAQGRLREPDRVEARYDSTTNHMILSFGPPILDAGTFYNVTQVADSSFAGRWTDGSYIVSEVKRGNAKTLEHRQGYFCARRETR